MLRGRVREVTVLFSDLKGFTELTRRRTAAGATELHVRQLNTYLGAMVEVITAHGGTVDKFIGDAVMAVFGSPVGRGVEREAAAAVACALAMRARLAELNAGWGAQGVDPLASGVGLASGVVLAGQIGSPQRLDFTVIGDTVNLASRLEALTRSLAASVCIDAATARLLADDPRFGLHRFGVQAIKGLEATEVFGVEEADPLPAGDAGAEPPS
jgi:adenylate cyclase